MKIITTKPYFSDADIEFVLGKFKEILEGKAFLSQDKYCKEFEHLFSEYVKSTHSITVTNGTCSLEIILRALNIQGDVIVPTNTFAATAFAVMAARCNPVFADCEKDLNLSIVDLKKRITKNTKAVIFVHVGGLISPRIVDLVQFCKDNNLYLIEDAAHAHGSTYNGKYAGTFGIAGSYSFFSTKVITTGEGGMIVTDNSLVNDQARLMRDQAKVQLGGYQNYHEQFGYNWRMAEVTALLGIRQLKRLDDFINRRNELAVIFNEQLGSVKNITIRETPKGVRENFYKYIIYLEEHDRNNIKDMMKQEYDVSLGGFCYEIPLHKQPFFQSQSGVNLPVAEDLCSRHICMPMYYEMSDEEAVYAAKSLKECLQKRTHS